MFGFILPKKSAFFALFSRHAALCVEGAQQLELLLENPANAEHQARKIKQIEHDADTIAHETIAMVQSTFVTPIERGDIHRIVTRIDDVMDFIEAASQRFALYDIVESRPEAREMARVLTLACQDVKRAIDGLADLKHPEVIRAACVDINKRENEADTILRLAIARLFREEKDPMLVIKWKEIYENIEDATDRCEDVADVVNAVVTENS